MCWICVEHIFDHLLLITLTWILGAYRVWSCTVQYSMNLRFATIETFGLAVYSHVTILDQSKCFNLASTLHIRFVFFYGKLSNLFTQSTRLASCVNWKARWCTILMHYLKLNICLQRYILVSLVALLNDNV